MRGCPLHRYSRRALPLALLVGLAAWTATGQSTQAAQASSYDLRSPDERIEIRVRTANGIRFDVIGERVRPGRTNQRSCLLARNNKIGQ